VKNKLMKKAQTTKSASQHFMHKLKTYAQLMRVHKPIGTLLLLWPTLWGLWLAAKGLPSIKNLVIFILGVFIMRSAGCVINDVADRKIDGKVARTQDRPLVTGAATPQEAVLLFLLLCCIALALVLQTSPLVIQLSLGGLALAVCYPFMKRYTHLPQLFLGAAFAWSLPMAFTAEAGLLDERIWLVYLAVVLWTVTYDTFYAMVDRDYDLKIGVKSTAILFGEQDRFIAAILQLMTLGALVLVGERFSLSYYYYGSLGITAALFAYQQYLIRFRTREGCFKAFLNNNWVGMVIFIGIASHFTFNPS
jgi:4-hydroxybenzoate polyprenyltransferase